MKKIFAVIAIILSVLLASSCQKDKMLEGTWIRVLQEDAGRAKYECLSFDGRRKIVTLWYETGERVKLDQYDYTYSVSDNHVYFPGYDLHWSGENTLAGTYAKSYNVAFFRQ